VEHRFKVDLYGKMNLFLNKTVQRTGATHNVLKSLATCIVKKSAQGLPLGMYKISGKWQVTFTRRVEGETNRLKSGGMYPAQKDKTRTYKGVVKRKLCKYLIAMITLITMNITGSLNKTVQRTGATHNVLKSLATCIVKKSSPIVQRT